MNLCTNKRLANHVGIYQVKCTSLSVKVLSDHLICDVCCLCLVPRILQVFLQPSNPFLVLLGLALENLLGALRVVAGSGRL